MGGYPAAFCQSIVVQRIWQHDFFDGNGNLLHCFLQKNWLLYISQPLICELETVATAHISNLRQEGTYYTFSNTRNRQQMKINDQPQ
jgi:hypothetical protein